MQYNKEVLDFWDGFWLSPYQFTHVISFDVTRGRSVVSLITMSWKILCLLKCVLAAHAQPAVTLMVGGAGWLPEYTSCFTHC
jgi:hypothetical protein